MKGLALRQRTALIAVLLTAWGCTQQAPVESAPEKKVLAEKPDMGKGKYASVNGLKMYYEIHGSGQPLVLLHGAFGMAENWVDLLPKLGPTRQFIILEQQGHGRTEDRDAPLTYEQMAEDTAALLMQLDIRSADVFGYSDGGIVGIGLAIHHPNLVRRLAILGANSGRLSEVYEPKFYQQYQSIPDDFAPDTLKKPYDQVAPDKSKWPVLVRKIKEVGRDFKGYPNDAVKSIQAPTLILMGDRDAVRPEHAVEMFRLIPRSQLAIFPGANHFLLFTNPDKVAGALLPFLDSPDPTPQSK